MCQHGAIEKMYKHPPTQTISPPPSYNAQVMKPCFAFVDGRVPVVVLRVVDVAFVRVERGILVGDERLELSLLRDRFPHHPLLLNVLLKL